MACACSVFSFAMMVRLLISYLLFNWRSLSDSPKSSATSAEDAPESEPRGDRADMTMVEVQKRTKENSSTSEQTQTASYQDRRSREGEVSLMR